MDVKINQVILHILDAGASEPVLSDRPMELDADLYEYFSVCIEKAFASDDSKNCRFLPDSPFLQEMQHNDDFIDLSRRIAGVIFEQLLQYQGIPSGDLAVVDCAADGVPFYAVLKLNYRPGFTHVTNVMGNGQCSTIAPQRTRMEEQYPLAVPAFEQALADSGVERNDRVTVSPSRIKKLESRSFKTESGIEIKIPAELCNSDDAVEFIHSATGGLSLLIKDVLV